MQPTNATDVGILDRLAAIDEVRSSRTSTNSSR